MSATKDAMVADLVSVNVDAWTVHDIEKRLRFVSQIMAELIGEQESVAAQYVEAEVSYKKAYHEAHLRSVAQHPDRRVSEHESCAVIDSLEEYTLRTSLKEQKASLRSALEAWGNILDILRTLNRNFRGLQG